MDDLEARLHALAGFHTGFHQAQFADQHATPLTHLHERVHDEIFARTSDGLLHCIAQDISAAASDRRVKRAAERLVGQLFRETREPHECAATYVSVRQLQAGAWPAPRQRRDEYVDEYVQQLPQAYKAYFATFSRLVDVLARPPRVRYAIAKGIYLWSFSSERICHVSDLGRGSIRSILSIPGPSRRFKMARRALRSYGLPRWGAEILGRAAELCDQDSLGWGDIYDEAEWEDSNNSEDQPSKVTAHIVNTSALWLSENVSPLFEANEIGDDVRAFLDSYGIPGDDEDYSSEDALVVDVQGARERASNIVSRVSRSRVLRSEHVDVFEFKLAEIAEFAARSAEHPVYITIMHDESGDSFPFSLVVRTKNESLHPRAMNGRQLNIFLGWLKLNSVSLRIEPPVIVDIWERPGHNTVFKEFLTVNGYTLTRPDAVEFYVSDVNLPAYEIRHARMNFEHFLVREGGTVLNGLSAPEDGERYGIMLLHPADLRQPALCRILSVHDFSELALVVDALEKQGRISSTHMRNIPEALVCAISSIMMYSSTL